MTTTPIDILIRGAQVIDGTGNPWFYGDVAIAGERVLDITAPGQIAPESAREVVDATGLVVCPGFIDILSHSHIPLMYDPRDLSKITQGVTTEIWAKAGRPRLWAVRSAMALRMCLHLRVPRLASGSNARRAGRASAIGWMRWSSAASRPTSALSWAVARCANM